MWACTAVLHHDELCGCNYDDDHDALPSAKYVWGLMCFRLSALSLTPEEATNPKGEETTPNPTPVVSGSTPPKFAPTCCKAENWCGGRERGGAPSNQRLACYTHHMRPG
jgi:hypothetical protein